MAFRRIAGAAMLAALVGGGSATAGEQTLKFRLVTMEISGTRLEVANVPGRSVGTSKNAGVAVFEDGRIAYKSFVDSEDGTDADGSFTGYSTYTFENGDALTMKHVGGWSAEGVQGDYEVLSGTGAFEGTTGTGHFDGMPWEGWEGAYLLNGSLTLEVPGT